MRRAFVLMTAMPPTIGHRMLIEYAHKLSTQVTVIVCTQPGEPFAQERYWSILDSVRHLSGVSIQRIHKTLPQEPEGAEGFWDMWASFLTQFGFWEGDYIVASEKYGVRLAEEVKGMFMPFDIERSIRYTKGTRIREDYRTYWEDILPEFRRYLQKRVTIFGAESVGKTTTAELLTDSLPNARWYFEWARPYLESVGAEITTRAMRNIYKGQTALQQLAFEDRTAEFSIFDTDLYSTIGYWEMYDRSSIPRSIYEKARTLKSNLYVILSSDIPFEADQLRYGGHERESTDQYWINLCERENLEYVYVRETEYRVSEVRDFILEKWPGDELKYTRAGTEYEKSV